MSNLKDCESAPLLLRLAQPGFFWGGVEASPSLPTNSYPKTEVEEKKEGLIRMLCRIPSSLPPTNTEQCCCHHRSAAHQSRFLGGRVRIFLLLLLPDFQFSVSYYRYVVGRCLGAFFCIASFLSSNRDGGGGGAIRKRRSETGLNSPSLLPPPVWLQRSVRRLGGDALTVAP